MSRSRTFLALGLTAMLIPACSDAGPTAVDSGSAGSQIQALESKAAPQSAPDLSGDWNWRNVEALRMPRWFVEAFAPVLGITAEGENTHARCESMGTMTLAQAGAHFEGTATKASNACETTGGQTFQQPGMMFDIAGGRISGKSVRFSFHTPMVRPCPHHAVISQVQGGVAAALRGTGRCILPGHPQSGSMVLDPPPGGTSTTLRWEAWRP